MSETPAVEGYVLRAELRMQPEPASAFPGRVKAALPAIEAEPGTRQFECFVDYDDPTHFLMYEDFDDEAAFHAHRSSAATTALRDGLADTFAAPAERTIWTQVSTPASPRELRDQTTGHVTSVRFRLKPDRIGVTAREILGNVNHMTGIVRFDLNQSVDDPAAFFICARWTDRTSWEMHQHNPEYQAFTKRVADNYDGPASRTLWRSLP